MLGTILGDMEWAKEKDTVINTVGYHKLSVMRRILNILTQNSHSFPVKCRDEEIEVQRGYATCPNSYRRC